MLARCGWRSKPHPKGRKQITRDESSKEQASVPPLGGCRDFSADGKKSLPVLRSSRAGVRTVSSHSLSAFLGLCKHG